MNRVYDAAYRIANQIEDHGSRLLFAYWLGLEEPNEASKELALQFLRWSKRGKTRFHFRFSRG